MRNRRAYWGLVGVGVGLLTASVWGSTPTFSFKLAGINRDMFRDTSCSTDDDCPAGSACTLTEVTFPGNFELRCGPIAEARLRCVGGTTPGVACHSDGDCGGLGQCRGLVEPGDDIIIEAYLSGWDSEPEVGRCNNGDACSLAQDDCAGKHCSLSGQLCFVDGNCPPGQTCINDECREGPLLGAYQWTVDCATYESQTTPYAGSLEPTVFPCNDDDDCHHGFHFPSQCTCARSECNPRTGLCDLQATAYFELFNFLYVYRDFSHEKLISTNTCNYQYAGAASRGGKADDQQQKYVGTIRLTVPFDAYGTYMVNFEYHIDFTCANEVGPVRFPAPNLEPLVLEFPDPCADFLCPPPPTSCAEWVCEVVEGFPDCVRQPIVCDPDQRCIPSEGGCVDLRTCCAADASCTIQSERACESAYGTWHSDILVCDPNPCGPVGACCHDDVCSLEWWEDCVAQGGDYLGDGVFCEEGTCPRAGACCVLGYCSAGTELGCMLIGGRYLGYGVPCDPDPCADIAVVSSVPPHDGSLWRSWKNIVRISFDGDLLSTPTPGRVEIIKLLPDGAFGPDLSALFTFDVEGGRVLRIQDTGATLQHRKWYAIRNVGNWAGVAPFEIQYVVQMGDCDGNGLVISLDVGCVNAGIPCFEDCGDDDRKDMDADGRVVSLDVGVVNAHIGSFAVEKPTGH